MGIPGIFSQENGTPEKRSGEAGPNESSSGNWEDPREEDGEREEEEEEEKEGLLLREDEEDGGDFDEYDELALRLQGRGPRDVDEESIKVSILSQREETDRGCGLCFLPQTLHACAIYKERESERY